MGIHQYRTAQRQAESPQQSEYRVLAEVTRRLMEKSTRRGRRRAAGLPKALLRTNASGPSGHPSRSTVYSVRRNPLPDAVERPRSCRSTLMGEASFRRPVGGAARKIQQSLVEVNKAAWPASPPRRLAAEDAPGPDNGRATA